MSCTVVSTSGVSFGDYDTLRPAPVDSLGFVAFRCTSVTATDNVMIHLSRGDAGSFHPRAMAHRGFRLEYNLFLDAGRAVVWGDGSSGTSTYLGHPAEGQTVSVPIYGRILPRQGVRPGGYGDSIVVTIQY